MTIFCSRVLKKHRRIIVFVKYCYNFVCNVKPKITIYENKIYIHYPPLHVP